MMNRLTTAMKASRGWAHFLRRRALRSQPVLILSSYAKRKEYALNFISLLALPRGAEVVYRYSTDLFDANLKSQVLPNINKRFFRNARVLFGHVAETDTGFRYIPCRFGMLIAPPRLTHSIVQFRVQLGSYAYVADSDNLAWLAELETATNGGMRFVQGSGEEGAIVTYCDSAELPMTVTSEGSWLELIKQFAKAPQFRSRKVFFRVNSIKCLESGKSVSIHQGILELAPRRSYEILFFHMDVRMQHEEGHFRVKSSSENLYPVSNPQINIFCPYDINELVLRTGSPLQKDYGFLTLSFFEGATSESSAPTWSDDLKFSLRGSLALKIWLGVFVGVLLWIGGSGLLDVIMGIKRLSFAEGVRLGLALLTSIGAAMLVVFNFKKLP